MLRFWLETYRLNPIPTVYATVSALIFTVCLFIGLRMLSDEEIDVFGGGADRLTVIIGYGIIGGIFWGIALIVSAIVAAWYSLEFLARLTRPRSKPVIAPSSTPVPRDLYLEAGQREVDAMVTADREDSPTRKMRSPADFLRVVNETIARGEICILFAEAGPLSMYPDPNKIWPEMLSDDFRIEVLASIQSIHARSIRSMRFSPPDDLDGWTFSACPRTMETRS
jgi:hypothetical protein